MCGIYGWQLNKRGRELVDVHQRTILTSILAHKMNDRGSRSFGAAMWSDDTPEPVVFRQVGSIVTTGETLLRQLPNTHQCFVHTRAPTTGAVTVENCHPFQVGNTLGVHNGMVSNHFELNNLHDRGFEVDSKHIFAHIEEEKDLQEVHGYGAVVYYNMATPGCLYTARFNNGTLAIGRLFADHTREEVIGLVFASTESSVSDAVNMAGLYGKFVKNEEDVLYLMYDGDLHETGRKMEVGHRVVTHFQQRTLGPASSETRASSATAYSTAGTTQETSHEKYTFSGKLGKVRSVRWSGARKSLICNDCTDALEEHYMGECFGTCNRRKCTTSYEYCADCGCALVEDIHAVSKSNSGKHILWCEICRELCSHPTLADPDQEEDKSDEEITQEIAFEDLTEEEMLEEFRREAMRSGGSLTLEHLN